MLQQSVPLTMDPKTVARRHADAIAALIEGEVRFGKHDRMLYATDASIYQVEPLGVVIPRTEEDVHRVLAYAHEHKLPVLPRGGGTSLAGQCTSPAIVIDTSVHLRRLLEVDPEKRTCRVQAGKTLADLNKELEPYGLFFAPDPSTTRQANVGGCIGNNAAGTRSVKYGRTVENLVSLRGFMANGEPFDSAPGTRRELRAAIADLARRHAKRIRERYPRTLRRNAGYALDMVLAQVANHTEPGEVELAPLIAGSEGTLVFVTEATLTLHPIPMASGLAVLGFSSVDEAVDAVVPALATDPSAVELLDDLILDLAKKNTEHAPSVARMPKPEDGEIKGVLYVEYLSEEGEEAVARKFDELRELVEARYPSAGFVAHTDKTDIARALELRRAGEPLLHAIPGARKPLGFIEDNAIPPDRLGEFVRKLREIIEREGTRASFWAHASVGVLHVRPLLDLDSDEDNERMERIAVAAADLAKELGGVMSGEHGDGKARGPLLERFFGPELMEAFTQVKELFDPHHLLNPGNIVPVPGETLQPIGSIHERTRKRPTEKRLPHAEVETYYSYEHEGGYHHAMELCNGAGVCRKSKQAAAGAMCPSYMASRDERHSTRGRGNALRLAITGQLEEGAAPNFNDAETLETLDLCLSCKACKTECPSNVDVARYKAEYIAQSRRHGLKTSVEDRFLANIRLINRLGALAAPFANFVNGFKPTKAILDRLLGYAPQRSLPRFEKSLMRRARKRHAINAGLTGDAPEVIIWGDCFTSYNEPAIGMDAAKVLNAFGYRVRVLDAGCCARPMISNGLLEEAVKTIRKTCRALERETSGAPVVVLEASCLSALVDDWRTLNLPEETRQRADTFADRCTMLEQFLEDKWDAHPKTPEFTTPDGRVALHPHCHQRALWGADSSGALLRRLFGESFDALDTTCCGMAGAFGFASHRFELSMAVGEQSVFPSARALTPGDAMLATGTSCRHQIHDGVGRESLHPATFLASHLA